MSGCTTRFAPSPNGMLHLGHAYSAIRAHDLAQARAGTFLLRIEDIDGGRSRPALVESFRADLTWLGLGWKEVAPQSLRLDSYTRAADRLRSEGLLYPCRCTRAQVVAAARQVGVDGPLYPGTCRRAPIDPAAEPVAWRLDMEAAVARSGPLTWVDEIAGEQKAVPQLAGDVALVRKDALTPASYHLAATLDDAADGVTLVTRGRDLFQATHIHRLLQALLGLPVPTWHHHALLMDAVTGRKLAKSRRSPSLAALREEGVDGREVAQALRRGKRPAGIVLSFTLEESA